MRHNSAINSNVMTSCIGSQQAITTHSDKYRPNSYTGKCFYDDDNYRAVLELLNGGYDIAQDIIAMMEDYCDLHCQFSKQLISFSDNWTKRINRQNTLCSYNTTKRAQLETVKNAKKLADIEDKRIQNIQQIINKYRKVVNDTYVTNRLSSHQHRRTKEFKKQFKEAHQMLTDCKTKLDQSKTDYKKALDDLKKADSAHEIISSNVTTTEIQRKRSIDMQTKRRGSVNKINEQIQLNEDDYSRAIKTYRKKAKLIFQECQKEESNRLDLIKETLLNFCQAIQIEDQNDLDKIYLDLAQHIQIKQNSWNDILYWAQSYGIIDQNQELLREDLDTSVNNKTPKIKKQSSVVEESSNTQVATSISSPTITKKSDKKEEESGATMTTTQDMNEEEDTAKSKSITKKNSKTTNNKKATVITSDTDSAPATTVNILAPM